MEELAPKFHVLIAAGGSGQRFGASKPKQYIDLCGAPLIRHCVKTFQSMVNCGSIQVIIGSNDAKAYHDALGTLNIQPPVIGSITRKDSVYNGLKALGHLYDEDLVLVHDAARACISTNDINALLEAMKSNRAASLACPISSTLRQSDDEGFATDLVDRHNIWAMQTPQAFHYGDLRRAHEQSDPSQDYTDDTALVSAIGIAVKLVQGSTNNIKITHPQDLQMAENIMKQAQNPRITLSGMGFDVHAFDEIPAKNIRLCGIDVVYSRALKGHSDADVVLHALTDALLGAIGAGDIGRHFPPSDPKYKNMDSVVFLEKALELLIEKDGVLHNIDLTILCEEPKITPHEPKMRQRLHEITTLSIDRINIKATTTERLGFTGRGEGIAAQALVTVSIPEVAL